MNTRGLPALLLAVVLVAPAAEPPLYRSVLRLAPSEVQLQTLPAFPAQWLLPAGLAADLPQVLAGRGFAPGLAAELARRRQALAGTADVVIVPDRPLLARFTPAERASWHELLGRHIDNITYRWPLSLGPDDLAALGAEPRWAEAVRRLRATGLPHGDRLVFGDLFALEDAFATPPDRRDFYRRALEGGALVLRLRRAAGQPLDTRAQAAWWQANGRYRAIEPMLNAVASIPNAPRLDLAHILPRLPRSLLNSFPPDFAESDDAGVESSAMASDFFELAPGADPRTEGGFADWLAREAVPAAGPRQYGDLLVYGDPDRTAWPYTAVYIADGIGLARRPTAFGPWQFIDLADIGRLNPRFAGKQPAAFRNKAALTPPGEPPFTPDRMPEAWRRQLRLESVPAGPWGRLAAYDVLLAPAGDVLERLPAPDPHPRWTFAGLSREQLLAAVDSVPMPEEVRAPLRTLFAGATPDAAGRLTVEPPIALVLAVPAAFRTATFAHLVGGLSVTDYVQHIPFPRGFTVGQWFETGSLPESVRRLILQLVYPAGDQVMLSDFGALYHLLNTRAERLAAHRAALRVPALVVLLEKPAPGEVAEIARYWTLGRDKSVRRLLESFAADPAPRYLDIVHLLSPVERELINTYFTPPAPGPTPSCFWTAFNFGMDRPDDRYLVMPGAWTEQRELAGEELSTRFDAIPAPGRLGDIIGYRRRGAAAFDHLCVFLAGDLVFTKNGFTFSSPWCITRLGELDGQYLTDPGMERVYFRRRAAP